jgi:hypothetical protein
LWLIKDERSAPSGVFHAAAGHIGVPKLLLMVGLKLDSNLAIGAPHPLVSMDQAPYANQQMVREFLGMFYCNPRAACGNVQNCARALGAASIEPSQDMHRSARLRSALFGAHLSFQAPSCQQIGAGPCR